MLLTLAHRESRENDCFRAISLPGKQLLQELLQQRASEHSQLRHDLVYLVFGLRTLHRPPPLPPRTRAHAQQHALGVYRTSM